MITEYKHFDLAYEVCRFLDTLKEEQVIDITSMDEMFYVFYKKE